MNHHLGITASASDLSPKSLDCTSISSQSDCNLIARNTQQQPTSKVIRLSYCTTAHERAVTNARRGNILPPFSCRPHIISMLTLHLLSKTQYKTSKQYRSLYNLGSFRRHHPCCAVRGTYTCFKIYNYLTVSIVPQYTYWVD